MNGAIKPIWIYFYGQLAAKCNFNITTQTAMLVFLSSIRLFTSTFYRGRIRIFYLEKVGRARIKSRSFFQTIRECEMLYAVVQHQYIGLS